jgi:DNA polymerase III subunit gamma/tau
VMLARMGNLALVEASAEVKAILSRQAQSLDMPALLKAVRAFNAAANDARGGWQPQLPLELAIVDCTGAPPAASAPMPAVSPTPVAVTPVAVTPAATRPAAVQPVEPAAAPTPPAPASPAPLPETSAPPPNVNLKASWTRLLTLVREKDKATEALLRSCNVAGMEGNLLKLTTQVKLACEKINDHAPTRQLVANLLSDIMGFPCNVQCTLTGGRGPASGRGTAGRNAKPNNHVPDGLVFSTLQDLGGEIVED